jgi:hypothetical protein
MVFSRPSNLALAPQPRDLWLRLKALVLDSPDLGPLPPGVWRRPRRLLPVVDRERLALFQ